MTEPESMTEEEWERAERARVAAMVARDEEPDTCPVCGRAWEECEG